MATKIKGKPSLDSLILRGHQIKKINLYLEQYLNAEIKLKYSSAIFNYININIGELDNILNFCSEYKKTIFDESNEIRIPRKKDVLINMILDGYEIEKIKTFDVKLDSVAVIHFKDKGSFTYNHMTPSDLGKYMLDYWRFQRIKTSGSEVINLILVNKGSEEKLFQDYKKEVIQSFCTFLGLPNNYSNKDKN